MLFSPSRCVFFLCEATGLTRACLLAYYPSAADVANLVLDGADGIVLGSETFRGKFAVACADTVLAICRQVRRSVQL